VKEKRKPDKRKRLKRLLILLLIFLLFISANLIAGKYAYLMQHQRYQDYKISELQLQMEATRQAYRTNTIELDQRVSALEQQPTYKEPVTHKKVQEPKVTPVEEPTHNPFKAPTLDPLIPLTGIFTLFGMLKLSQPIGG
jgi:cell division protein FtsB